MMGYSDPVKEIHISFILSTKSLQKLKAKIMFFFPLAFHLSLNMWCQICIKVLGKTISLGHIHYWGKGEILIWNYFSALKIFLPGFLWLVYNTGLQDKVCQFNSSVLNKSTDFCNGLALFRISLSGLVQAYAYIYS